MILWIFALPGFRDQGTALLSLRCKDMTMQEMHECHTRTATLAE
jgi:hypothetical protein